jgi:hypothetical protein
VQQGESPKTGSDTWGRFQEEDKSMSNTEIATVCEMSDAEIDAISGGWLNINTNVSTITQVNAVGVGGFVDQSNQAVNIQANQSFVNAWVRLRNRQ